MATAEKIVRVASLKSVEEFREHLRRLKVALPCDDSVQTGPESPLLRPISGIAVGGKTIGNRWAVHPMEGWDGTTEGGATDLVRRRWQRFGQSGAKLI